VYENLLVNKRCHRFVIRIAIGIEIGFYPIVSIVLKWKEVVVSFRHRKCRY
jgi:hypothetical protein